ncbi:hypothetical protein [Jiangella asiatica]|uniref:Heavy-metal-associated domain-containing protein n=1 Tax=Jiangella asiatica TaxID=2530372 RepID=A0A4R5DNK2_9ACTN|nr:hypothetical protein [Jiangella asiatica]TDE15789.1 hypothetical protein E1269_00325 [Jiangella asiatica]
MNAPAKLGIYALCLAGVFALAAGIGRAAGPIDDGDEPAAAEAEHGDEATDTHSGDDGDEAASHSGADGASGGHLPGGLMVSDRGYTFALDADTLPAGPATPLSFRILGPDGAAVTTFEEEHDEELHLIAVRRDLTGYQHVHPVRDAAGTWSIPLALTPGEWKLFADFVVPGEDDGLVLAADLAVAGAYQPAALPEPATTAEVDGYTVTLDGEPHPGEEAKLTLSVSRDGRPVTDLEPYLGAYGHLVALRDGDLAYLHVHPDGEPGDGTTEPGPDIAFYATAASAGDYRLFLDFKHDGVVRTAEFTVRVPAVDDHGEDS